MCVYIPAALSNLYVPLLFVRSDVLCVPETGMSGGDIEVPEDDVITETVPSSLELARETERAGVARVVLAVDTPTSTAPTPDEQVEPRIFTVPVFEYTWSDVAATLAGLPDTLPTAQAVLNIDIWENVDEVVAVLREPSLAWFNRSERPAALALHRD